MPEHPMTDSMFYVTKALKQQFWFIVSVTKYNNHKVGVTYF
jgi:hypothetical protein